MSVRITRVHPLLWVALAGTALWALLGGSPSDDEAGVELARPAAPAPRPAPEAGPGSANAAVAALNAAPAAGERAAGTAGATAPAWPAARERLHPDSGRGLMGQPPPPPAPPPQPAPPAPPARPLAGMAPPAPPAPPPAAAGPPLLLMGVVKTDTPEPQVFFTLGDRLIQARVGETIDGRFRIESITAAKVVVVVLPDNNRVEIPISTTTPGG